MARSYYEELNDPPVLSKKYDYSKGRLIFEGTHTNASAVGSDSGWKIKRFTEDEAGYKVAEQGPIPGIWDNRVKLEWATVEYKPSDITPFIDRDLIRNDLLEQILDKLELLELTLGLKI
jgi:hypothetical protein